MIKKLFSIVLMSCCLSGAVLAQGYSIVIKDGHVIDPKNNIDAVMDVAIDSGKVVKVAKGIDTKGARQVVDAKGLYVTPGLIDIHAHVFQGTNNDQTYENGPNGLSPDGYTFRVGVTTVADAGSSGWRTFPEFKKNIIDIAQTRVFAFLNIVGEGMRGGVYEQNVMDMDAKLTAGVAMANRRDVVGVKLAHYNGHEWTPTQRAVAAGTMANIPVMVDFGGATPTLSLDSLFNYYLRPGDIFTHCFGQLATREYIVDVPSGKVKPFVIEAQKKGLNFDVGFGGISFSFSQAIPAIKSGFFPTSISTDLHTGSMNNAMKDQLSVMNKCMTIGMDLVSVIRASTSNPAKEIKHEELGNLSVGSGADVAIFSMQEGKFGFFDYTGYRVDATKKLECEMTIRAGRIVYDLNGIAAPVYVPNAPRGAGQRGGRGAR